MRDYIKILLLASLTLITGKIYCQEPFETETVNKHFILYRVTYQKSDTAMGLVYAKENYGLISGRSGEIKAGYKKDDPRSEASLGTGLIIDKVDKADFYWIYIVNKHPQKADSNFLIRDGDIIELPVSIVKTKNPGLFRKIDLSGVVFTNNEGGAFVSSDILWNRNDKQFEDSMLNAWSFVIKSTVAAIDPASNPQFTSLIENGRYKGKNLVQVMKECSPVDIRQFLLYVLTYTKGYYGKELKLSESFGGWVVSEAPVNAFEVYDTLNSITRNLPLLKKKIAEYRKVIIDDNYFTNWVSVALDKYNNDDLKGAEGIFNTISTIAGQINEPLASGLYYVTRAEIYQNQGNFKKAIQLCDSGIVVLRNTTDQDYLLYQCHLKRAYCLRELKDKSKCLAAYDAMKGLLLKDTLLKNDVLRNNILGRIYKEEGNSYFVFEDFQQSISSFTKGIEEYKKNSTYGSTAEVAELQRNIAIVYEKQNRNKEAELIYRELIKTYQSVEDGNSVMSTAASIAYIQTKQGEHRKAIINYKTTINYYLLVKQWETAGYNLSQIGQCYWNLGMYDSAIDAHHKALEYQYRTNNNEYKAYAWGKLGSLYSLSGLKEKGLFAQDSALYYAYKGKDTASAINYLLEIGNTFQEAKDDNKALEKYREAEALSKKIKTRSSLLSSIYNLAEYYYQKDTAIAASYYKQAAALALELGDKNKQIYTALSLGLLQNRQLKFANGEVYFKKAFSTARAEQNIYDLAKCYTFIGTAAEIRLQYDSALYYYNRAYHLFDSIQNKQQLAELKVRLGNIYVELFDYARARKEYEAGLQLAIENKNETDKADLYGSLSYLYLMQGNNKVAKEYLDKIKTLCDSTNNATMIASLYISYGNYYSRFFEMAMALDYYRRADSIYLKEGDISNRITCLNNIGNIYLTQRDNDKALSYFTEGMKLSSRSGIINDLDLLLKLNASEALFNKKEYVKALAMANECEKLATKAGANRRLIQTLELKGMITFKQKDYKKARVFLQKVIDTRNNNESNLSNAYLYLGRIAKEEKKYTEGFEFLQQSKSGSEAAEDDNSLWEVLYETGNIYLLSGKKDSAIYNYKKAVEIVSKLSTKLVGSEEEKNKLKTEETKTDLFNKLIATCVQSNQVDDAVYYTNLANLQGIKDKTGEAGIAAQDSKQQEDLDKAKDILQRKNLAKEKLEDEKNKPAGLQNEALVETLAKTIKTAEEDYENYIDDLATKYESIKVGFAESVNPQKFAAYKKSIPDSVACLLYIINQQQLYIFSVTSKETRAVTVELNFEIDSLISTLKRALQLPQSKFSSGSLQQRGLIVNQKESKGIDYADVSSKLYNVLVRPVAEIIDGKKTLCIIPTGRLSLIPFQVLSYKQNNQQRFLIEDFEIFYTSQLEVFYEKNNPVRSVTGLSAFGNPDKTLPDSEKEINNLKTMFGNEHYFIQDSATETKARQSLVKDRFVHFATHGILDYNDFRNSYLVFAGNDQNDAAKNGRLTIREIKSLKIEDCELVTLSACETGVNKEISKGWYISPANSFLVKGVKTVVASLWKVHDEATSILMTEFYKNIEHMSKAEALRQAQISLTHNPKYQHPYYWAPFLLYGSWR
ncbi:MAG: CHAT domain-containing protein [Chitinophagaceae bacterium]|nr:CHAT domain-containing protein [Chitinophagaceae bacterium]